MSKVIGIVSEGPTDYLVLKSVIDKITGEENKYLALQPEADMMGRYGNGWKGVWKWCKETAPLDVIMDSIQPRIDIVVIQMDGDVFRKEKEVHCQCVSTECIEKGKVFPLYCENVVEGMCPIEIPCISHADGIEETINHGKRVLDETINVLDKSRIIIAIPCDSTDAWIVAAYDDFENVEKIEDPWRSVIAKRKYYHDVRVRGDKKSINTYSIFVEHLVDNWNLVTEKCRSAKLLEQEIARAFI